MRKVKIIMVLLLMLIMMVSCQSSNEPPGNLSEDPSEKASQEEPEEEVKIPSTYYDDVPDGVSPLTGDLYDKEGKVVMVQLENTPAARPQSGITQAELIYEIEVESHITRLTAFFYEEHPEKVGPVRSARRQHMYLWKEWDYPYAYYGGSGVEGQNIYTIRQQLGITAPSFDGTRDQKGVYFRTNDREAPHNAYLNMKSLVDQHYDYDSQIRSLYYDQENEIEGEKVEEISFSYTSNNAIGYKYNEESQLYGRFINGESMKDQETGKQLEVKNIILQYANHYKVEDTVYTNIDLVGSGQATYFRDGIMSQGTWTRDQEDDVTIYYDENGEEIAFPPGKTFIQIVRPDIQIAVE